MLEEGVVPCSFTTVFSESAEVTGGKVVVTDSDMSSLSPALEYVEGGAVIFSDVVRCVSLTVGWREVVVSPEWDVS